MCIFLADPIGSVIYIKIYTNLFSYSSRYKAARGKLWELLPHYLPSYAFAFVANPFLLGYIQRDFSSLACNIKRIGVICVVLWAQIKPGFVLRRFRVRDSAAVGIAVVNWSIGCPFISWKRRSSTSSSCTHHSCPYLSLALWSHF